MEPAAIIGDIMSIYGIPEELIAALVKAVSTTWKAQSWRKVKQWNGSKLSQE